MYIVTEVSEYLESCNTDVQIRYANAEDITIEIDAMMFSPSVDELKAIVKVFNKAIRDVK